MGEWQGKTVKQLSRLKLWKVVQQSPSQMRFPGGESFAEAQQRLVAAINAIAASHDPKDLVACFSHCDAIRLVVTHFLGMPLDCFQRLSIDTASLTILSLGEHGAHLGPINYIPGMSFEPPEEAARKKDKTAIDQHSVARTAFGAVQVSNPVDCGRFRKVRSQ